MDTTFYTTGELYSGNGKTFEVTTYPRLRKYSAVEVDGEDGERCKIGKTVTAATYDRLMQKMEVIGSE